MKKMWTLRIRLLLLAVVALSAFTARADDEPNDNVATAESAAFGTTVAGSLNQTPVGDLDDYYLIEAPEDGSISVSITMGAGLSGYVYIYDKTGAAPVQGYVTSGNSLTITKNCMAADQFLVRVDHYEGAGTYSFTTSVSGTLMSGDVEDNGTITSASQYIEAGETFQGHIGYYDADLGYDELDYVGVILPADGSYTFKAIRDAGKTSETFYLRIKRKNDVEVGSQYSYSDTTAVTINCLAADTVYMVIDRNDGCGGYMLSFENTTPPGTASDEEDNSSIENTTQFITEGEEVTGHIGYFDMDFGYDELDYFGAILPADGSYTFKAIRDAGKSSETFYLRIKRKDGQEYLATYTYNDTVLVTVNCLAADTVYMVIDRNEGCGGYSLSFENTTPPGTANDEEDNSSIENTTQFITEGEEITGHIGYFDVDLGYDELDFFGAILPANGSYTFKAIRDAGKASETFYLRIKRKDGTEVGAQYSYSDTTAVTINCLAADTVYMAIDRNEGCGGYTLSFENTTPPGTADDEEDNSSIEHTTQFITEGEEVTGNIGYYDVDLGYDELDYFGAILPKDGSYTFKAVRDAGKSSETFYLRIKRKNGVEVGSQYSHSDTTVVTINCLAADTVYMVIDRYDGCGGYSLSFSASELTFANDTISNETIAEAAVVATSSINEGHLGYVDSDSGTDGFDFYKFTVVQAPFELDIKLSTGENLKAYLRLYNAGGSELQNAYYSNPGMHNFTRTITVADDYYIALDHYEGCGSYSLGNFCADAPEVAITADGPADICPGESVTLTATPGHASYIWYKNGAEAGSGISLEVSEPGTYYAVGHDINGCDGMSNEIVIGVFGVPELSISTDNETTFCSGGSITLWATAGFDSYLWSNGETGASIVVSESGNYSVTATTADGCDKVSSNTVEVTVLPDSDSDGICDVDDSCPSLPGEIGDACDDGDPNTENDLINAECECEGTPVVVFDCPDLEANVGDSCDDGDTATENDLITADCECEGTPVVVFDCPDAEQNIGDACNDGNPYTENDTRQEDCSCAGTPITENTVAQCTDGIDNDGDGLADCEDPGCQAIADQIDCIPCLYDGLSFADSVLAYETVCTNIDPDATNPAAALGMPGYNGQSSQHATLGRGYIKLAFTNNTLVNSGTPASDLYVFEVGPLVESSFIELRPLDAATEAILINEGILDSDNDGFYEFGDIGGATAAVDIDAFFDNLPANSVFFDAIKITDATGNCATETPGADIDAVCALSSAPCAVGASCDDGNPLTENDVIGADCNCSGTPIVYDCPDLEANIGDSCDDGDAATENDLLTADCECEGTPVVVFDCPDLEANIGDSCDDGDATTENDLVNADCECEGTPVVVFDCPDLEANIGDSCDDGDASTENDLVTADCECEGTPVVVYDCPDLEANIGDSCDDGNAATENDLITPDCECEGTPVVVFDCPDLEANIGDSCGENAVINSECDCVTLNGYCAASRVVEFEQGPSSTGGSIAGNRSNPASALGQPQDNFTINFVALGYGGHLIVKFDGLVINGAGYDLKLFETTYNNTPCEEYEESAEVYVSTNGTTWFYLGSNCQDGLYDISSAEEHLPYIRYVKIVDVTSASSVSTDGYDVDAVVALHPCVVADNCAATSVVSYTAGLGSNGNALPANRSNPEKALGQPQNNFTLNFVALGYGGELVLEFNPAVLNGYGYDISVFETTYNNTPCAEYEEYADIYISQDGTTWLFAGTFCRDALIDIAELDPTWEFVQFIKFVDQTPTTSVSTDGYDIDGVISLNGCIDAGTPASGNALTPAAGQEVPIWKDASAAAVNLSSHPNPASTAITLTFEIPESEPVRIEIINSAGQVVQVLHKSEVQAGMPYETRADISNLPNGIYLYKLSTSRHTRIEKFMISR